MMSIPAQYNTRSLSYNNKTIEKGQIETNKKGRSQIILICRRYDFIHMEVKDLTRKFLQLKNCFSKAAGYEIDKQKSIVFLYTNDKHTEKEIRQTVLFTIYQ